MPYNRAHVPAGSSVKQAGRDTTTTDNSNQGNTSNSHNTTTDYSKRFDIKGGVNHSGEGNQNLG
jgi:hypothetical protein